MIQPDESLIDRLDAYCDAAPRTACRAEVIGPFTLFVNEDDGWEYYARPTLGSTAFCPSDVDRVRRRQRRLRVPEAFEWIAEAAPTLEAVALEAGLAVGRHPLMVLGQRPARIGPPPGFAVRLVGPHDNLAVTGAVAALAFSEPGTAVGDAGIEALTAALVARRPAVSGFERARIERGVTVTAVAEMDGFPVALGSHQPVGDVSEVAGIGTLPAFRRRGLGASITSFLVDHARGLGIGTLFLSAGDDEIARVYGRLGFEPVGTSCVAEPAAR